MYKILKFDLGRNALRHIVQEFGIKKMHIPYYLCSVVRHILFEAECKPIFYHIDDNFFPEENFSENDYILYPNYWGVCKKNVKKLIEKYPNLIVDNAHAFYDEPCGFACFNAGHKFGYKESYLWIKNESLSRCSYTNKNYTYISNKEEITIRKQKFIQLHNRYKNINMLEIDLNVVPFCYPCLLESIEQADNLVKILKEEGKIIYRYWNPLPKSFCEYKFYSRLVPIPILPALN